MKEYAGDGGRAKRAKRRTYVDGMSSSDEESEILENGLDPEDLYKQKVYPPYFVKEMQGEDVSVEYFQKTGFKNPIFVRNMAGLNMKIPDSAFNISDVKNMVGGKRILEVMNTATQSNAEMTLKVEQAKDFLECSSSKVDHILQLVGNQYLSPTTLGQN